MELVEIFLSLFIYAELVEIFYPFSHSLFIPISLPWTGTGELKSQGDETLQWGRNVSLGLWDISYSHRHPQPCSCGLSQPSCELQPPKNQDLYLEKSQGSCCSDNLPTYTNIYRVWSEPCCLPFIGATSEQLRHLHPESKITSMQKILIFPAVPGWFNIWLSCAGGRDRGGNKRLK